MNCKCGNLIPAKRVEMGYRVCVNCSTEQAWSAVHVVYHKTGNTIEVVKDPEVAALATAMSQRTGFGVMKGLTGNHRKSHKKINLHKAAKPVEEVRDKIISRKPIQTDWYAVGEEAVGILETAGIDAAIQHLEAALENKRIIRYDMKRLVPIIEELAKTM